MQAEIAHPSDEQGGEGNRRVATENDFSQSGREKKREKRNKINLRGGGEHRGAQGGASDAATNRNLGVLAASGSISLEQSRAQK